MSFESIGEGLEKKKNGLGRLEKSISGKLAKISLLRLLAFLLLVLWPVLVYLSRTKESYYYIPTLLILAGFIFLVIVFQNLEIFQSRISLFQEVIRRETHRHILEIQAMQTDDPDLTGYTDQNSFCKDLDIFGNTGLFAYLDTTATKKGEEEFLKNLLLLQKETAKKILSKQDLIRKISSNRFFTFKFIRMFREARSGIAETRTKIDLTPLKEEQECFFKNRIFLKLGFRVLVGVAWLSFIGNILTDIYLFTSFFFLTQLAIFIYYRNSITLLFRPYENFSENMRSLQKLCKFSVKINSNISSEIIPGDFDLTEMERSFTSLNSIVQRISVSHSPIAHFLLNLFFLWDLWIFLRVDEWNSLYGSKVAKLLEAVEFLDSVIPFAHFAVMNPDYVFPSISEDNELYFENIHHPLISRNARVGNDLGAIQTGKTVLITGSNMSGKTTFLRTIGVNAILGLNGAPVPAEKFHLPPLVILSSIRNEDSLADGVSFFYAEVKRISSILKRARDSPVVHLILLDELLQGTNSKERLIASKAILKELQKYNTINFITTHDIDLAKNNSSFILKYFSEIVVRDKMSFDYKMRDGIVKAGNALKILELEGLNLEFELD